MRIWWVYRLYLNVTTPWNYVQKRSYGSAEGAMEVPEEFSEKRY
jgi:hypothetical protein